MNTTIDARGTSAGSQRPDIVVLVDDPMILASVRRVAAAVDRQVEVAEHPLSLQQWNQAPAVVLDAKAARAGGVRTPRRQRVFLVCSDTPTMDEWRSATEIGAEGVLSLPDEENALVALLADQVDARGGIVVSVVNGCGGGGASVTAAAVSLTAASRGVPTLLMDVDALGSGADVLLGIENVSGLRWGALTVEAGRLSPDALRDALPAKGKHLRVLSTGRGEADGPSVTAARAVVEAGRSSGGLVVCDVPRHPDPVGEAVLAISDHVLLVVPATVAACVAAEKVGAWISRHNSRVGLVVRGPSPGGLRAGDVCGMLQLPLVAVMRGHRSLAQMLERGGLELSRGCPLSAGAASILDSVESGGRTRRSAA